MKSSSSNSIICVLAIALLLSEISPSHGLRILGLLPPDSRSHFVMTGALMRGLTERGHQVDVYGHFPVKQKIPNYTDYTITNQNQVQVNFTYQMLSLLQSQFSLKDVLKMAGHRMCEFLDTPIIKKLIQEPPKDPPYDIIVMEYFMSNCYLAFGRHLNLPIVAIATTTLLDWTSDAIANPSNTALEPSVLSELVAPMTFFERLTNTLLVLYSRLAFRYYISEQSEIVEKSFGPGYPSTADMEKDIDLILSNHHHVLNGVRPFLPSVIPVGGLHVVDKNETLDKKIQKFLDDSTHGFVYFTFGSMVRIESFPKSIIEIFYGTFKEIAPVRVLMKITEPELLPPGLPSNVMTHPWLPQVQILKHKNIRVFITHGGLMGTQESIYYGVPMVGIPLFADQHYNMKSYVQRKIAIKIGLNEITKESLKEAVADILNNPVYKNQCKTISAAFKDNLRSPMDTAAFWIEYVARHGKRSLRSPGVDMPWWQVSLLDVYGFLLITTLTAVFTIKFTLSKLICFFMSNKCCQSSTKVKSN